MTRGGRQKDRDAAPERRCIVTGEVKPAAELIRFVVGPDGVIVPDLLGKLPGRGIWVTANRAALDKAVAKNLFARAARQPVTVPEGLVDHIEAALAPFDPRPHWGKLFTMPAAEVQSRYARLDDFRALLERHDPRGKFRNAFVEEYVFG